MCGGGLEGWRERERGMDFDVAFTHKCSGMLYFNEDVVHNDMPRTLSTRTSNTSSVTCSCVP